jgi:hypothetical protein
LMHHPSWRPQARGNPSFSGVKVKKKSNLWGGGTRACASVPLAAEHGTDNECSLNRFCRSDGYHFPSGLGGAGAVGVHCKDKGRCSASAARRRSVRHGSGDAMQLAILRVPGSIIRQCLPHGFRRGQWTIVPVRKEVGKLRNGRRRAGLCSPLQSCVWCVHILPATSLVRRGREEVGWGGSQEERDVGID